MKFEELTEEQKDRIEKFWNKEILSNLMTSNIPTYVVEHNLCLVASSETEKEFFEKSTLYSLI